MGFPVIQEKLFRLYYMGEDDDANVRIIFSICPVFKLDLTVVVINDNFDHLFFYPGTIGLTQVLSFLS